MRYLILSLLCLTLGLPCRAVDDLSRFLEARDLRVLRDVTGEAITVDPDGPAHPFERYAVEDAWHNRYVLNLVPPVDAYEQIVLTAFLEAIGVPHIPSYPVFVKRGLYGIPGVEEAVRLGQGDHPHHPRVAANYGKIGADGGWFVALIQPEWVDLQPLHLAPGAQFFDVITLEQMVDLAKALVTVHLLRADGYDVGVVNGHMLLRRVDNPFIVRDTRTAKLLEKELWDRGSAHRAFPVKRLSELTEPQARYFNRQMGIFVARVEKMLESGLLRGTFQPLFDRLGAIRRLPREPRAHTDYWTMLRSTATDLRANLNAFLKERVRGPFARQGGVLPRGEVTVELPFLGLVPPFSTDRASWHDLRAQDGPPAKDSLLSLALSQPEVRAAVALRWRDQLGRDPIAHLLAEAAGESRMHILLNERFPALSRIESAMTPQYFLNIHAPHTLLVVSPNDPEGRLIESIGMAIGPFANLEVYRGAFRQGQSFTRRDALDLRDHVIGKGFDRVIVCEMGDTREEHLALVAEQTKELIRLDHHGPRFHRYSVLEQFFRIYNYYPSLGEWLVGVRDRSLVYGFSDFGYDVSALRRYLESNGGRDLVEAMEDYRIVRTDGREIYEINYDGPLEAIVMPFAVVAYPDIANVMIYGRRRIRFSGRAAVARDLARTFAERYGDQQYSGGDPNGAMFWGLRTRSRDEWRSVRREARRIVQAGLGASPECWRAMTEALGELRPSRNGR